MTLGPLMLDIAGTQLSGEDRELLRHPAVGGVILFARNYADPAQLTALTSAIHALRSPPLLIAVDQEGGRVQRLRDGFVRLPPARALGQAYDRNGPAARQAAEDCGWLMAAELLARGVDFSFAPVADLDRGCSRVIGNRAFHATADGVSTLAQAWARGMRLAGMAATVKHFPGHGGVAEDTHDEVAVDRRAYSDLGADLTPFRRLIADSVAGVMTAHVVFPEIDQLPVSLSSRWIKEELRTRMGFEGTVFCDDLSMAAAGVAGTPAERAQAALRAGCDMVLVCNDREGAGAAAAHLVDWRRPGSQVALVRMHGRPRVAIDDLFATPRWQRASAECQAMCAAYSEGETQKT